MQDRENMFDIADWSKHPPGRRFVFPISRRSMLYPWEDLASLIARVTRKMGYGNPRWILALQGNRYRISASLLTLLYRHEDYQFLEQQLLIPEATLRTLSAHRFAHILEKNQREFSDNSSSDTDVSLPLLRRETFRHYLLDDPLITKVCPQCLDELLCYDRLYRRMKYGLWLLQGKNKHPLSRL